MYLLYKVVFLAVLFLPWYKEAHYIYRIHLREIFRAHETITHDFFLLMVEKVKKEIFIDSLKNKKIKLVTKKSLEIVLLMKMMMKMKIVIHQKINMKD